MFACWVRMLLLSSQHNSAKHSHLSNKVYNKICNTQRNLTCCFLSTEDNCDRERVYIKAYIGTQEQWRMGRNNNWTQYLNFITAKERAHGVVILCSLKLNLITMFNTSALVGSGKKSLWTGLKLNAVFSACPSIKKTDAYQTMQWRPQSAAFLVSVQLFLLFLFTCRIKKHSLVFPSLSE